jgi:Putative phage serine protease XkdF
MLFLPITKADAKQRMVYGVAVSEIADRSGEIFDYATSKPEFEKWSLDARKMSGDKSYGNVRGMHGKVVAGKLTDIGFDDKNKAIEIAAKIIDKEEWQKVEEGVYTGFSIGGQYLKRWDDGELKRYTARPTEISLVDVPCVPTATFTMIKLDGSRDLLNFRSSPSRDDLLRQAALEAEARRIFNRRF